MSISNPVYCGGDCFVPRNPKYLRKDGCVLDNDERCICGGGLTESEGGVWLVVILVAGFGEVDGGRFDR